MNLDKILDTEIDSGTLRDYLKELLITLWKEGESFSGKRPFGNSGWQWSVYATLVENGHISGKLDEDGYIEEMDEDAGKKLMLQLIEHVFNGGSDGSSKTTI